jgi:hypothetical protein
MEQHPVSGVSTRESYWRSQMASCESSGLTIAAYCRQRGVSPVRYRWWKGELKRRDRSRAVIAPFAEVRGAVVQFLETSSLEVALPGERRIVVRPGFDAGTLAEVVRVLESVPCAGGA